MIKNSQINAFIIMDPYSYNVQERKGERESQIGFLGLYYI